MTKKELVKFQKMNNELDNVKEELRLCKIKYSYLKSKIYSKEYNFCELRKSISDDGFCD
jgi:hypothetical protein